MIQTYNLRCKKFAESKNQNVSCTSPAKVMLPAHCVVCNSKKNKLGLLKIKKQVVC